jgi:CubicO group peptidase (beta-lactamase class C family)
MEKYIKHLISLESINNYSVIINDNNTNIKFGSDDKFAIGSMSKSFGAYLLYSLVQKKLCNYEDLVSKYFPLNSDITLRDLIEHNTPYDSHLFTQLIDFGFDIDIIKQKLSNEVPTKDKEFHYNNIFYIILSKILEKISGSKTMFNDLLSEVGMNNTGFTDDMVQGYYTDTDYMNKPINLVRKTSVFGFAGGIISTTNDMLLWLNFIQNKKDFLQLNDNWYGNGLWTADENKLTRCHTGSVFGYSSAMLIIPEYNFNVCVLCNLTDALFPSRLINYIMRNKYNLINFSIVAPIIDELPLKNNIINGTYHNDLVGEIIIYNKTININNIIGDLVCIKLDEYVVKWRGGQYNYYNSDKIKQIENGIELIFESLYHKSLLCKLLF